jgi:hypothetical protein
MMVWAALPSLIVGDCVVVGVAVVVSGQDQEAARVEI